MYMLNTLLILTGYVLIMTLAFQGLLGAYYRWMRTVAGPFSSDLKVYKGKNATFWGLIFFFIFLLFGIFSVVSFIESSENSKLTIYIILTTLTVLSFYIALSSRKFWPYKSPKRKSQPKKL